MGAIPIIGGDKIITAILLASMTLGKVHRSDVPDLRIPIRDCRACTAVNCPLRDSPGFKYLYDDPVLDEICSHHWR